VTEERIGSYVVESPVGRGGMGVVYKGRHAKLPRVVAIKSIDPHMRRDLRRLRSRFEREAFVQSQLDHPSIVKIYDYVVSEQTYHIVMEFVEGSSLAQLLAAQGGALLPLERALGLFEKILEAVAYAHSFVYRDQEGETRRGMIHRDLKPPNILVTPDDRVKITDFGIVKLAGGSDPDTLGLVYGTPHYVSPEQAQGREVDQRSDIYSLGVILYEMLTGTVPFGGLKRNEVLSAHVRAEPRKPSELNPEIGPELERAVCRSLEKKAERRYSTVYDFWRAVRRARGLGTEEVDEQEAAPREPAPRGKADTGRLAGVTAEIVRGGHTTQQMTRTFCDSCGVEAEPGDHACRACGLDLKASPATRSLARSTPWGSRKSRLLIAALAALAVAALGYAVYKLAARDADAPAEGAKTGGGATVSTPAPQKTPDAPPVAPADVRQLSPLNVRVDSNFDGYVPDPLTDGVTDVRRISSMRYNRGNWVSAETAGPHHIDITLDGPRRVSTVYVFWGFDRGRFMPSRRVELYAWAEGRGEVKISELEPGDNFDRTAFTFEPVVTSRLRIQQPAEQGPPNRPFVMWVREVQVFGAPAPR
jgi:tRNA A-37 threonylcarbamoyl transferase component Bud32